MNISRFLDEADRMYLSLLLLVCEIIVIVVLSAVGTSLEKGVVTLGHYFSWTLKKAEAYSKPSQTSTMELFYENS